LRFPGQYFDSESNLNYNYFRDYDPTIGRYAESDPIGLNGGLNTYAYASDSGAMNADPLGLATVNLCAMCHSNGIQAPQVPPIGAVPSPTTPTAGDVIDFGKYRDRAKPKDKDKPKSCPPDDDGWCERDQKLLLSRQLILLNMHKSNLMPLWQYRISVQNFNMDAETHNLYCPSYPVAPIPLPGPSSID
jgi:RHS repeat-associated protein